MCMEWCLSKCRIYLGKRPTVITETLIACHILKRCILTLRFLKLDKKRTNGMVVLKYVVFTNNGEPLFVQACIKIYGDYILCPNLLAPYKILDMHR